MKARIWVSVFLVTLSTICFVRPATSQQSDPDALLKMALDLRANSYFDEAIQKLDTVSSQFPRTQYDLSSRLHKAYIVAAGYQNFDQAISIYQSIGTDFPSDPAIFLAGENVADIKLIEKKGTLQEYLETIDALIKNAGGVSIFEIMSGRSASKPSQVPTLTLQQQSMVLADLYSAASCRMSRRPASETTPTLLEQALRLKIFLLANFPMQTTGGLTDGIRDLVVAEGGIVPTPDQTPPKIVSVRPTNQTGRKPDIVIKVNDGPIFESQVNIRSLQLLIDGVDVSSQVMVRVRIARNLNSRNASRRVFESIKIRYRPSIDLSIGLHSISFQIADFAGNVATKAWNLNVGRRRDDADDDSQDNRWDLEPDDNDW